MKTEIEVTRMREYIRKHLEEGRRIISNYNYRNTMIENAIKEDEVYAKALDWVLEVSEQKRGITDLSKLELKELCDILCVKYDDDVTVFDYIPHFETLLKFSERLQEMFNKPKDKM